MATKPHWQVRPDTVNGKFTGLKSILKNNAPKPIFYQFFLVDFVVTIIGTIVLTLLFINNDIENIEGESYTIPSIFSILFLNPLVETLIFQFVIIEALLKSKKVSKWGIIVTSHLLFSLGHYSMEDSVFYNILYIFFIFLSGLIYSLYYYLIRYKFTVKRAILGVLLLHSASNFIVLITEILFGEVYFEF